jgi:hypothetical protein
MISGTIKMSSTKVALSLLMIVSIGLSTSLAQSDEILAKSYFLKAQEAYGAGENRNALENLEKTVQFLGTTNAKIEALFVKVALNLEDYINAEKHLSTYFEVASSDHSAYQSMLSSLVDVKENKKKTLENLEYYEGLARIKLNGKYGFYDKDQNLVIPAEYDFATTFTDGYSEVRQDKKYGYIDKTGKVIVPIKYDDIINYNQALQKGEAVKVELNDKKGLISIRGEIVSPKYDAIASFANGLAKVELNGKSGFIDQSGRVVIPIKYQSAYGPDKFGLIEVMLEKRDGVNDSNDKQKYGAIDKAGTIIIPLKYASVDILTNQIAKVREYGTEYGFAGNFAFFSFDIKNKTGKEISKFINESIFRSPCENAQNGLIVYKIINRSGYHSGYGLINFEKGTNTVNLLHLFGHGVKS